MLEVLNPQFLHVITDSLYAIKELCYHCQNLLKYNDKFDEDCLCVCRKVHFEVFRRIVANASWVRKCARSAWENAWPVTMCYTDEGARTVLHRSSSPLPAVVLPTAPMLDINQQVETTKSSDNISKLLWRQQQFLRFSGIMQATSHFPQQIKL